MANQNEHRTFNVSKILLNIGVGLKKLIIFLAYSRNFVKFFCCKFFSRAHSVAQKLIWEGKKFSRELIFVNFFFGHFAGINFRALGFTEDFAGIDFCELGITEDFAGIDFRE